ncbi:MAG: GNAT family N-acetyltransferase [Bacteroidetes bacterium]|nr:GNAT family N-acetyltransferase [Bacteroidota bacterium]MBS1929996.1 GNAT family N-acetyltransferase [Bacteroidota bacterium]
MIFRQATIDDIESMHEVRLAVTENALTNPDLITFNDYKEYLLQRGLGWVCESGNVIVGFAIVDLNQNNVWALFVKPGFEMKGIGRKLHDTMLECYFSNTTEPIWLSTAPGTRAETFYRKAGWVQTGVRVNGEIKFEMTYIEWEKHSKNPS